MGNSEQTKERESEYREQGEKKMKRNRVPTEKIKLD